MNETFNERYIYGNTKLAIMPILPSLCHCGKPNAVFGMCRHFCRCFNIDLGNLQTVKTVNSNTTPNLSRIHLINMMSLISIYSLFSYFGNSQMPIMIDKILCLHIYIIKQECIPVGCILTAAVVATRWQYPGVSVKIGIGVSVRRECLSGLSLCQEGSLSEGVSVRKGGLCPEVGCRPASVKRMTDNSETLPSLAFGNQWFNSVRSIYLLHKYFMLQTSNKYRS